MQYQTIFEYLGFDVVDKTELINNRKKKISNYPYIHLGRCIHVDVIKDFLREHNVKFDLLVKTGAETPQKQENATL